MLSCLLGQNQIMVYLLSKCGGGENTEVLKNQSYTSAITLRMEKDLQEALKELCSGPSASSSGRKEGAITCEVCVHLGQGTRACLLLYL